MAHLHWPTHPPNTTAEDREPTTDLPSLVHGNRRTLLFSSSNRELAASSSSWKSETPFPSARWRHRRAQRSLKRQSLLGPFGFSNPRQGPGRAVEKSNILNK